VYFSSISTSDGARNAAMTEPATTAGAPLPALDLTAKPHGLREVAAFFLRLGTVAFGGPAAHIAMMDDELVRRRSWFSPERGFYCADPFGDELCFVQADTLFTGGPI
jgi:hypothetical protein